MSLAAAIGLAGAKPVELIKIDAQGLDVSLVMATDPAVLRKKVRTIQLETIGDDCNTLYEGQRRCGETIAYMRSIGYRLSHGEAAGTMAHLDAEVVARCSSKAFRSYCEADLIFERV